MQQSRVIGIFQVFLIELPVARQNVAVNPQQLHFGAVERCIELFADRRAEVILDGFHVVAGRCKDDAAPRRYVKLAQSPLRHVEIRRHAALSLYAAAERHGRQIALQAVGPVVIGAYETVGAAPVFAAEFDPAMGAAVLEDMDLSVHVAGNDNGERADIGPEIVPGLGHLAVQADIVPVPAEKNLFQFEVVDASVGIYPVRDQGVVVRPDVFCAIDFCAGVLKAAIAVHRRLRVYRNLRSILPIWRDMSIVVPNSFRPLALVASLADARRHFKGYYDR